MASDDAFGRRPIEVVDLPVRVRKFGGVGVAARRFFLREDREGEAGGKQGEEEFHESERYMVNGEW